MKVGDLVKHLTDGALGICTGVDKQIDQYTVTWFDCHGYQTPYNASAVACHIEVINEAR